MNDKDWEEKEEFWDNEIEDDDEDNQNGFGGNIDANNDETFENAAEWNEDEHEELIARDLILSNQTHQRSNRNNLNTNSNHSTSNSSRHDHVDARASRFPSHGATRNNSSKDQQHFALFASTLESPSGPTGDWEPSKPQTSDRIQAQLSRGMTQEQPRSSTSNDILWQGALGASQSLQLHQLQQQAQEQLRLLSQSKLLIDQEQSRLQQMNDQRRLLQQRQQQQTDPERTHSLRDYAIFNENPSPMQKQVSQPKVLTVDELERQLLKTSINQSPQQIPRSSRVGAEQSRRAGWSPFGSKDLFNTDDHMLLNNTFLDPNIIQNIQPQTLTLDQQRLILEQQKLIQQQQQLQQLALIKQQQHEQQQRHQREQQQRHQREQHQLNQQRQVQQQQQLRQQQQNADSRCISSSAQCFTVEEIERQMLANRGNTAQPSETIKEVAQKGEISEETPRLERAKQQSDENRQRISRERLNGDRHDKFERHNHHRELIESREHYRRDTRNHREHFKHHRKEPTIIPPQVQLGVIDKTKRTHPITAKHSDEFLQDRAPTSSNGFRFMRHSKVSGLKANHDGVLTDKERDWLTRIQAKIQADYDDNIDQDYYYLLYFNRSSMTDEATQKPSGPGVFDRRFIPRERLLYNTGV